MLKIPVPRLLHAIAGMLLATLAVSGGQAPARMPLAIEVAVMGAKAQGHPELRRSSERATRAPDGLAARTRRAPTNSSGGALTAPGVATGPASFLVQVQGFIPAPLPMVSECDHCTRAARPPPIRS